MCAAFCVVSISSCFSKTFTEAMCKEKIRRKNELDNKTICEHVKIKDVIKKFYFSVIKKVFDIKN